VKTILRILPLTFVAAFVAAMPAVAADLVIAMPNWPSGQATANILKVGIAKKFGLEAEVKVLGTMNAFVGLDAGEVDIQPEVWRPNFDDLVKKYVTEKGVVTLSSRGVPAWQGLCATPEAAATIKTVADLSDPEKTKILDTDGDDRGEICYAANLTLVEAEEEVAMVAVDAAVATGRPMVFYCYAPHHVFELHKLVRIEEPPHDAAKWKLVSAQDPLWIEKSSATTAWDAAEFHIAYATAFGKKHPDIAKFLEQVDFSPEEVTGMSYALEVERQVPLDFATKWVEDNAARVDGWAKK
jgi:glycine betaine/proline transport system substrate-binding protein